MFVCSTSFRVLPWVNVCHSSFHSCRAILFRRARASVPQDAVQKCSLQWPVVELEWMDSCIWPRGFFADGQIYWPIWLGRIPFSSEIITTSMSTPWRSLVRRLVGVGSKPAWDPVKRYCKYRFHLLSCFIHYPPPLVLIQINLIIISKQTRAVFVGTPV